MFRRLLLAIDGCPAGSVSLSFTTAVALEQAATVHVVHVNQLVVGGRGMAERTDREASELVGSAVDELRANGVEATGEVRYGTCFNIGAEIAESARSYDAIIVGSRRRGRLRGLRGRGTREQIVKSTDLPVITAPGPLSVERRIGTKLESSDPALSRHVSNH